MLGGGLGGVGGGAPWRALVCAPCFGHDVEHAGGPGGRKDGVGGRIEVKDCANVWTLRYVYVRVGVVVCTYTRTGMLRACEDLAAPVWESVRTCEA
jgi:hypothetical protein